MLIIIIITTCIIMISCSSSSSSINMYIYIYIYTYKSLALLGVPQPHGVALEATVGPRGGKHAVCAYFDVEVRIRNMLQALLSFNVEVRVRNMLRALVSFIGCFSSASKIAHMCLLRRRNKNPRNVLQATRRRA